MSKETGCNFNDKSGFRVECDSLGEVSIPEKAYYGPETQRAIENFQISGIRLSREMIWALGLIKFSAAKANEDLLLLPSRIAVAVKQSAEEVCDGKLDAEFPIDIYQTGSGTSSNMNMNEVIARRACEILHGDVLVLSHEHVNLCQSSNDVFPSAISIALANLVKYELFPALELLRNSLSNKSCEFSTYVKAARTHLQDAAPITLGQEFSGYSAQIQSCLEQIKISLEELLKLPLGGTAVGTGLGAHPLFAKQAIEIISSKVGLEFKEIGNHFYSQTFLDSVLSMSSKFRLLALCLYKIANDIRLLASGPRCGLGEIILPEVAPGSSIMPGKINPVICESLLMVCAQVIGNDQTVMIGVQSGSILELNTMMPVIAHNVLQSAKILSSAVTNFTKRCVNGIKVNTDKLMTYASSSSALVTALVPFIGYDKAAQIAHDSLLTSRSIIESAKDLCHLSETELEKILCPKNMVSNKKA